VSAVCAGLAGSLLAIVTSLVAPGAFTLTLSIALLTAAVIGGLGSLPGALWGSLLIVIVPTYVTDVATSHGFVQLRRLQHPDRRLRRGPHPGHARLPAGDPGRAAPAPHPPSRAPIHGPVSLATRPRPTVTPPADEAPASHHEKEGTL